MLHLFATRILWENSLGQLSSEIFSQFVKIKKKRCNFFLCGRDLDNKRC